MVLPLIGKLSLTSMGVGAALTLVARPLIVGAVRVGYEAKDFVGDTWRQAKVEAQSVRADALATRERSDEAEIRRLREEVATLRAQPAKRTTA